jgi:hypothetical protein
LSESTAPPMRGNQETDSEREIEMRRLTWLAPTAVFALAACGGEDAGAEAEMAAANPCAANPCAASGMNPCASNPCGADR